MDSGLWQMWELEMNIGQKPIGQERYNLNKPNFRLPKYILINKTVRQYGYDPRWLKSGSNKKVIIYCLSCKKERQQNMNYISSHCHHCAIKKSLLREDVKNNIVKGLRRSWLKRGPQTVEEYIKSKIVKIDGCHIWKTAQKSRVGFFQFKWNIGSAPVKVYEALVGSRKGLCVLHKCDDQRCVNIKHLYLGTRKDNRRDFMERHPRAKQIMKAALKCAFEGRERFWKNMTSIEKKKFCKRRAKIQAEKRAQGEQNAVFNI